MPSLTPVTEGTEELTVVFEGAETLVSFSETSETLSALSSFDQTPFVPGLLPGTNTLPSISTFPKDNVAATGLILEAVFESTESLTSLAED